MTKLRLNFCVLLVVSCIIGFPINVRSIQYRISYLCFSISVVYIPVSVVWNIFID